MSHFRKEEIMLKLSLSPKPGENLYLCQSKKCSGLTGLTDAVRDTEVLAGPTDAVSSTEVLTELIDAVRDTEVLTGPTDAL